MLWVRIQPSLPPYSPKRFSKEKKEKTSCLYCFSMCFSVHTCCRPADLSAMCSCRASRANLLSVFHMASVSGDISSVSRNAVALETSRRTANKHKLGNGLLTSQVLLCQGFTGLISIPSNTVACCRQLFSSEISLIVLSNDKALMVHVF